MSAKTVTPLVVDVEEYDRRVAFLRVAYGEATPRIGLLNDLPEPEAIAILPLSPILEYIKTKKKGAQEIDHYCQFEILFGRGVWWCVLWVFWHDNDLKRPLVKHAFLYPFTSGTVPFLSLLASSRRIYIKDLKSPQGLLLEELQTEPLITALLVHRIAQRPEVPP